ncbi:hypothetical protein GGD56_006775 [Rhizobium mongolense]|uniref:Uncharacterized protein n=2 Tax=Rhizobium mongolense TaxID=57676 RepID=A0ABR6IYD1_9HYPH|nr:hypothetical protein [Rhizobium mongolense]TVZ75138.1 hypothetical protein BCL32_0566 [Rhizobium mongolense USDA 1844]
MDTVVCGKEHIPFRVESVQLDGQILGDVVRMGETGRHAGGDLIGGERLEERFDMALVAQSTDPAFGCPGTVVYCDQGRRLDCSASFFWSHSGRTTQADPGEKRDTAKTSITIATTVSRCVTSPRRIEKTTPSIAARCDYPGTYCALFPIRPQSRGSSSRFPQAAAFVSIVSWSAFSLPTSKYPRHREAIDAKLLIRKLVGL